MVIQNAGKNRKKKQQNFDHLSYTSEDFSDHFNEIILSKSNIDAMKLIFTLYWKREYDRN